MSAKPGGRGRSGPGSGFSQPAWSLAIDLLNRAGKALSRLGLARASLDEEELLRKARGRTGLDDFGSDDFREPLRVLLASQESEAELTPVGRLATRVDTLRLLTNRLRLVEDRKRHPEIAEGKIERPIFILGLPRTGSTFLHSLLARDPNNRCPRTWEVMLPSPPPGSVREDPDPRVAETERKLARFHRLVPEYRAIHRMGAEEPQECLAITSHSFASVRFHRTHYVPTYRDWLENNDLRFSYELHRRFLQHLSWPSGDARWVLKSPSHLFWLKALLEVYPDARVVQTHRRALTALASNSSQQVVLRGAFSDREGKVDTGASVRRWADALDFAMALREERPELEDRWVDLRFRDLIADPIGAARRLYESFGLTLGGDAERGMGRFVSRVEAEVRGRHEYSLEEFGFRRETHGPRFERYEERFGLSDDRGGS